MPYDVTVMGCADGMLYADDLQILIIWPAEPSFVYNIISLSQSEHNYPTSKTGNDVNDIFTGGFDDVPCLHIIKLIVR